MCQGGDHSKKVICFIKNIIPISYEYRIKMHAASYLRTGRKRIFKATKVAQLTDFTRRSQKLWICVGLIKNTPYLSLFSPIQVTLVSIASHWFLPWIPQKSVHLLVGDNLLVGQGHLHGALHEDGLGKSLEIWGSPGFHQGNIWTKWWWHLINMDSNCFWTSQKVDLQVEKGENMVD